jgi:hypothetical protein
LRDESLDTFAENICDPHTFSLRLLAKRSHRWLIKAIECPTAFKNNLSQAGFSWGCSSQIDSTGRVIFTAEAYSRDGCRFTVLANERFTAFLELQAAIHRQLEPR